MCKEEVRLWIYVSSMLAASGQAASHDITLSGPAGSWWVGGANLKFRLSTLRSKQQFGNFILYPDTISDSDAKKVRQEVSLGTKYVFSSPRNFHTDGAWLVW